MDIDCGMSLIIASHIFPQTETCNTLKISLINFHQHQKYTCCNHINLSLSSSSDHINVDLCIKWLDTPHSICQLELQTVWGIYRHSSQYMSVRVTNCVGLYRHSSQYMSVRVTNCVGPIQTLLYHIMNTDLYVNIHSPL